MPDDLIKSFFQKTDSIHTEVDRLFNELIHKPWGSREDVSFNPLIDLYEKQDEFVLFADLPGMKREDIQLDIEGNDLVLSGKRSYRREVDGRTHYRERVLGTFTRRMRLPSDVNREQIQADFHDGVLEVVLPKKRKEIE